VHLRHAVDDAEISVNARPLFGLTFSGSVLLGIIVLAESGGCAVRLTFPPGRADAF